MLSGSAPPRFWGESRRFWVRQWRRRRSKRLLGVIHHGGNPGQGSVSPQVTGVPPPSLVSVRSPGSEVAGCPQSRWSPTVPSVPWGDSEIAGCPQCGGLSVPSVTQGVRDHGVSPSVSSIPQFLGPGVPIVPLDRGPSVPSVTIVPSVTQGLRDRGVSRREGVPLSRVSPLSPLSPVSPVPPGLSADGVAVSPCAGLARWPPGR